MRNTKIDRRSQRTRRLLNQALLELMLEQRYEDITVQHVIDRANVGRSTFYAHYLDKEDLLVSEFTRMLDALIQQIDQPGAPDRPAAPDLTGFFQHVQGHFQLYKALNRGGAMDLLYKKGHERIRQNILQHLQERVPAGHTPAIPLALAAEYMAGAILSVLKWWLGNELNFTPEQMNGLFQQLVGGQSGAL